MAYLGSGYAIVTDFSHSEGDKFRLSGTTGYSLIYSNFVGAAYLDTGILYNNDLIAVVQDTTNVLYPNDFAFV